jgi:hypothetical protein
MVVLEKGAAVVVAAAATAVGMYLLSGARRAGTEPRLTADEDYRTSYGPRNEPVSKPRRMHMGILSAQLQGEGGGADADDVRHNRSDVPFPCFARPVDGPLKV